MIGEDMTGYFTDEQLAALREGYDRDAMLRLAVGNVAQHYAGIAPLMEFFRAEIYDPEKMDPQHRQRCLLAILATKHHPLTLSVHVYWSLAEGLSLRDVYQVLLVAAAYAGVDAFATSAFTMKTKTLPLLAKLIEAGGEAVATPNVVRTLVENFA
jgi:alkylhydroperoxidase/carboxymuconolactone decarboxylase family protein YurZ